MEGLSLGMIFELVLKLGFPGAVLVIWWLSDRSREKQLAKYRDDMFKVLAQYQKDMAEQRQMYEHNVSLVRDYHSVASDLKDVVVLNTQILSQVCRDVETNQFCPNVRLQKRAPGPVQGSER